MPIDRRWSDADRELAGNAYHWAASRCRPENCPGVMECCYAGDLFMGGFGAVLDALTAAGKLLPSDVETWTWDQCACGHGPADHPAGARCLDGLTPTQPATCACRAYTKARARRTWREPWREITDA